MKEGFRIKNMLNNDKNEIYQSNLTKINIVNGDREKKSSDREKGVI